MAETGKSSGKGWNIAFWILQGLLTVQFLMIGGSKLATPIETQAAKYAWVATVPEGLVRFIGVMEVLGALGLLLPSITRIKPKLTGAAAIGLATIMLLAIPFHISRGEGGVIPINVVFGSLMAFVAWGRLKKSPITPRA